MPSHRLYFLTTHSLPAHCSVASASITYRNISGRGGQCLTLAQVLCSPRLTHSSLAPSSDFQDTLLAILPLQLFLSFCRLILLLSANKPPSSVLNSHPTVSPWRSYLHSFHSHLYPDVSQLCISCPHLLTSRCIHVTFDISKTPQTHAISHSSTCQNIVFVQYSPSQ